MKDKIIENVNKNCEKEKIGYYFRFNDKKEVEKFISLLKKQ